MDRKLIIVCLVGILGALAGALGFAAEATRAKENQIQYGTPNNKCIFPRSPAFPLGLTAAMALTIAHTILNVATGCFCFTRGADGLHHKRTGALIYSILSWFTFIMAILLLLLCAAFNYKRGEETSFYGDYQCSAIRDGIFAGAAVLSLISVILGIGSFMMSESAELADNNRGDPWTRSVAPEQFGIAMGPLDPMFVHEDTYMRPEIA